MSFSGVYLGTVTRAGADGVFAQLPRLSGEREHGPLLVVGGVVLAAGDRIAAALLEGNPDRPIVLGRV